MGGLLFPWEKGYPKTGTLTLPPAASVPVVPVSLPRFVDLEIRGRTDNVYADPNYVQVAEVRKKRAWLLVQCAYNAFMPLQVVPTIKADPGGTLGGRIILDIGESVLFSQTGDMPWQGAVWVAGLGGSSTVITTEAVEFPWE